MSTNQRPVIIGIAGESGASKTTMARALALFLGEENTLVLSTDDLHRFVRQDPAWQTTTHLDPAANNLAMGDWQLQELKSRRPVYRSRYNHKTGHFDPPKMVYPAKYIIVEGLHAFYTPFSRGCMDFRIYVDTHTSLSTHWKLLRDTVERGYTREQAMEIIRRRQLACAPVRSQMGAADMVISLKPQEGIKNPGSSTERVTVNMDAVMPATDLPAYLKGAYTFLEQWMHDMDEFVNACEQVGADIELCQDMGGNISLKTGDLMLVKASGEPLASVNHTHGYAIVKHIKIPFTLANEEELAWHLQESRVMKSLHARPSMETALHAYSRRRCVIHAHPAYITLLLCLKAAHKHISLLFPGAPFIPYVSPGARLAQEMQEMEEAIGRNQMEPHTFFLQNHGIVVQAQNMQACIKVVQNVNRIAQRAIADAVGPNDSYSHLSFKEYCDHRDAALYRKRYLFPDAVIAMDHNRAEKMMDTMLLHNYIEIVGQRIGEGELKFLTEEEAQEIRDMEAEKYRSSL
jgi:uridine kinase/ribulose-5-phosphate 4-epimerase/fuculose-1-phosphate aldolase